MTKTYGLFLSIFAFALCLRAQSEADVRHGNGKNIGFAINPILLLSRDMSGELNIWSFDRRVEINVPIHFAKHFIILDDYQSSEFSFDSGASNDLSLFTTGLKYRQFFSEKQKGWFWELDWLFTHGTFKNEGVVKDTGTRNSFLIGIGYRCITKFGLFWAFSMSAGLGFGEIKNNGGDNVFGRDNYAWDYDLLKFGYAW